MTNLHPDLEALMPEPVKLVTACEDCCGTGHTGESQYMGEFQPPEYERCSSCDGSGKWIVDHHSPDQVRAAIAAMIEALCARVKAADDKAMEGDYMLDSNDCIEVLRGTWSWGKDAASTSQEKEGAKGS